MGHGGAIPGRPQALRGAAGDVWLSLGDSSCFQNRRAMMPGFDPQQIAELADRLGTDRRQASQILSTVGGQVDPQQHADLLEQIGIDPQRLQNGGYRQYLDGQGQSDGSGAMQGAGAGAGDQPAAAGQQYGGQAGTATPQSAEPAMPAGSRPRASANAGPGYGTAGQEPDDEPGARMQGM
jgi:hypothetical protein